MSDFAQQFATLMKMSHDTAEKRKKIIGRTILERQRNLNYDLCKEVAEFMQSDGQSKHLVDMSEFAEELADIVIMCMTIGYENEIRLWEVVQDKIEYNRLRND